MVKLAKPEDSFKELETLTDNAEEVLRLLELPFRVSLFVQVIWALVLLKHMT